MNKKDLNRLEHMLDAACAIQDHIKGKIAPDLDRDRLLLGGIIRELLLIGEAANATSLETQKKLINIPWREIVGMRNQLIHGYFDVDHQIVWSTITEDVPNLISHLQNYIDACKTSS